VGRCLTLKEIGIGVTIARVITKCLRG